MSVSTYCVSITVESPIGRLLLTSDGSALTGLYMEPSREWQSIEPRTSYATASNAAGSNAAGSNAAGSNASYAAASDAVAWPLPAAVLQLEEYFAGVRRVFDLPLRPQGTAFQRRVWDALVEIPYGQTSSYGELARRIDNPGAARAVGLANNRNPISIVVPCHRVIGADGSLTGYGGGLERKRWLLAHESLREGLLQGLQKGLHEGMREGSNEGLHESLHEGVRESLHEGLHRGAVAPRSL